MKKVFLAMLIASLVVSLTSCEKDDTFLGLEEEYFMNTAQETSDEETSGDESPEDDTPDENTPEDDTPEVDTDFPAEWGKIIGAGISAVPADDDNEKCDKKCLVIRFENGAVAVSFDRDITFPTKEDILAAQFTEGNFGEEYVSGVFVEDLGCWVPATCKDGKDRLEWSSEFKDRNLRFTSLNMTNSWSWQNVKVNQDGKECFSTEIDGYNFTVTEGSLDVYCANVHTMQLR